MKRSNRVVLLAALLLVILLGSAEPPAALAATPAFVDAPHRTGLAFDDTRRLLYVADGARVVRYDAETGLVLPPFALDGEARGIDVSPDGATIAVADASSDATTGRIRLLDAGTGAERVVRYAKTTAEGGAWSVAFCSDGTVLWTTGGGTGKVPLRRYDPATGRVTTIATVEQDTVLAASGDRATVVFAEGGTSGARMGVYRPSTGELRRRWWPMEAPQTLVAADRRGAQFAAVTAAGLAYFDASLEGPVRVPGTEAVSVAYSRMQDAAYVARDGGVRAYDTLGWTEMEPYRLEGVGAREGEAAVPSDVSNDGSWLFAPAAGGVRVVPLARWDVRGHAYDAATRRPLAGVRIRVFDARADVGSASSAPITETVTAADGSYSLPMLPAKRCIVVFADTTGHYRDVSFPGRGLPPSASSYIDPWIVAEDVDAYLTDLGTLALQRVTRAAGADRYQTALEVSRRTFASAEAAVIVSGEDFPDALVAAPLAGALDAPILLTGHRALPDGLVAELTRLGVGRVYVVGGEGRIPGALLARLTAAGLPAPVRLSGPTRYDTAAVVLRTLHELTGATGGLPEPFVVSGETFPDALSVAPFAYMQTRPILLVRRGGVPAPTASAWHGMSGRWDGRAVVVGGTGAVPTEALQQLADVSVTGGLEYLRIAGRDRYETGVAVAQAFGGAYDVFGLASGTSFPDALAGGAACGYLRGPLLLTPAGSLAPGVAELLRRNGPYALLVEGFGGEAVLSGRALGDARDELGTAVYDADDVQASGAVLPAAAGLREPAAVARAAAPASGGAAMGVPTRAASLDWDEARRVTAAR